MLALLPVVLPAQSWSPAQQEVIDQVETCFRSWWAATNADDFNVFEKACPCDPDFAVWSSVYGAPIGLDAVKDVFAEGVAAPSAVPPTIFVRPTRIKVVDDKAVIFYYLNVYNVDPDGAFLNFNDAMRTTFLHKVKGRWQLFADMVVPVSNE